MKITLEITDNEIKVVCEKEKTVGIILSNQPQQYVVSKNDDGSLVLSEPEINQDHITVINSIINSSVVKFAKAIQDDPDTGFFYFLNTL